MLYLRFKNSFLYRNPFSVGYEALVLEHQMLLEQSLCKVCKDDNATTVFLPCGHMCTCVDCAPAMVKCPICQTFVKGTVKAILS